MKGSLYLIQGWVGPTAHYVIAPDITSAAVILDNFGKKCTEIIIVAEITPDVKSGEYSSKVYFDTRAFDLILKMYNKNNTPSPLPEEPARLERAFSPNT